jgi:hypothetical protein
MPNAPSTASGAAWPGKTLWCSRISPVAVAPVSGVGPSRLHMNVGCCWASPVADDDAWVAFGPAAEE